jgi:hypothetical protein
MSRWALTAALAAVTMALALPAASAASSEVPQPPHRAVDADWTGIDAYDYRHDPLQSEVVNMANSPACDSSATACDFADTETARYAGQWAVGGHVDQNQCNAPISGRINGQGQFVTGTMHSGACQPIPMNPANSVICRHRITGEYWARVSTGSTANPTPGLTAYVQVLTDPGLTHTPEPTVFLRGFQFGDPTTDAFADTYWRYPYSGFQNTYMMASWDNAWPERDVIAAASESGAQCGWPELT